MMLEREGGRQGSDHARPSSLQFELHSKIVASHRRFKEPRDMIQLLFFKNYSGHSVEKGLTGGKSGGGKESWEQLQKSRWEMKMPWARMERSHCQM
jgi:hypothetical protein